MQKAFYPPAPVPSHCRWHLGPYVAPWNGCTRGTILHPPKHNGCVTRQECDVTCWKQLCGRTHFYWCTCNHLDKRGRSSNTLWKVKPSRGGRQGATSVRLKQSHLVKLPNKISCRTDTAISVHILFLSLSQCPAANTRDRRDCQHLTSTTMLLSLVKKHRKKEDLRR